MMLNATQKESSNSDVRLRSNRRPKFLAFNSFQQVNRVLALLRSVALFDSKLHIQDDVKCNYSQKMKARAQRARRKKKNQLIPTYESTGNRFAKRVHEVENLGLRKITGVAELGAVRTMAGF